MKQNSSKGLSFLRQCEGGTYCYSTAMTVQNCESDLWPSSAGSKKGANRVRAPDLTPAQGPLECWGHFFGFTHLFSGGGHDLIAISATFTASYFCAFFHALQPFVMEHELGQMFL